MDAAAQVEVARALLTQAEETPRGTTRRAAFVRCAINRMYYACLWACRQALVEVGCAVDQFKGPALHGFLTDCFTGQLGHDGLESVGETLRGLKTMRNRADYNPHDRDVESLPNAQAELPSVEFVLETLRDVRTDIDKFSALQPRAASLAKLRQGR